MTNLEDLFTQYGTDKGTWGYTPAYEDHLAPLREKADNVLEIGICGFRDIPNNVVGASLFAWRDYFAKATIYGLDNDGRFIFNDQHRIKTALVDAYDPHALSGALINLTDMTKGFTGFDFICDDAVHDPLPQLHLFNCLWPLLKRGGVYAIEEACPYKCPNSSLYSMNHIIMQMFVDAHVVEYQTHKDERLLVVTKG